MNKINDLELATELVNRLNNLFIENPVIRKDISKLLKLKVNVSLETVTHPTIQIGNNKLGVLGLLNGICGVKENQWGYVASEIDEETGELIKFVILE